MAKDSIGSRSDNALESLHHTHGQQQYSFEKRSSQSGASSHSKLAGCTGLEPATSDVTGRRSNQLS